MRFWVPLDRQTEDVKVASDDVVDREGRPFADLRKGTGRRASPRSMTTLAHSATLLVASVISLPAIAASASSPTERQMQAYRVIQQVAATSCLTPSVAGWSFGSDGKGKASLKPPVLAKLLTSSGVMLQAGVSYQRWSGLLQKDAGSAFSNRNDCVAKLSIAMIGALPTADKETGKPYPKPANPQIIYKTLSQQPTSQTDNSKSNIGNVNGTGQQFNNSGSAANYTGPVATGTGNAYQFLGSPPVTVD